MYNLEIYYKKATQQLRSGEAPFGKDGALAPMLERILKATLDDEMNAHLNSVDHGSGNRRNGKISKRNTILLYSVEGNRGIIFLKIKSIFIW